MEHVIFPKTVDVLSRMLNRLEDGSTCVWSDLGQMTCLTVQLHGDCEEGNEQYKVSWALERGELTGSL